MQRFTARFLIVLLLVSIMAPAAMALAVGPMDGCCPRGMQAHACCIRKAGSHSAAPQQATIQAAQCGTHCHCAVAITGHWAGPNTAAKTSSILTATTLDDLAHTDAIHLQVTSHHCGRAPPAISIA